MPKAASGTCALYLRAPGPTIMARAEAASRIDNAGPHELAKMAIDLTEEEIVETQQRLAELQAEHRDLDLVIQHLIECPPPDELLVRRLKKRKLQLRDTISRLEATLVPDIPA
jgi:hypothetical protein